MAELWGPPHDDNFLGWSKLSESEQKERIRSGVVPADYPHHVASDYAPLLEILEKKVKPERLAIRDSPSARSRKEKWWQFSRPTAALYERLSKLNRTLAISSVNPHLSYTFVSSKCVFAHSLVLITLPTSGALSILQSRLHEIWARYFSSSAMDLMRYTPTDCFETFPFPSDWETNEALEEAGRAYYEFRAALMIRNDEGLTKTYNRFHDPDEPSPDIRQLRELHAAMDRAVLDAYGWTDIPTACQFLLDYEEDDEDDTETTAKKPRKKKKPWRYRWPDDIRDEVLARLLALNAERAEQEKLTGTTRITAAKKVAKKRAQAPKPGDDNQIEMFPVSPVATPSMPADPWREQIAAFRFDLPEVPRPVDANALGYYRILIPALIQEAGGSVPWDVAHTAAALLAEKELLLSFLADSTAKSAHAWSRKSKLLTNPDAFAAAVEESILTSKKVRLTGTAPSFDLSLAPDVSISRAPWHLLDARFALAAATTAIVQGAGVQVSEELNEKIIQFARTA